MFQKLHGMMEGHRTPKAEPEGHIVIHWASFYDPINTLLFLGKSRAVREMAVEMAQIKPGERVLDVACGTGNLTLPAKARAGAAGEVQGIDASPEMIETAQRKAAKAGADIHFQVGLAEKLPYPDNYFDVVISGFALHHLSNDETRRQAFAEMVRVLKPGGRVFAIDFEPVRQHILRGLLTVLLGHRMMETDVRKLLPLMSAAGLTGVEAGPTRFKVVSFVRGDAEKNV